MHFSTNTLFPLLEVTFLVCLWHLLPNRYSQPVASFDLLHSDRHRSALWMLPRSWKSPRRPPSSWVQYPSIHSSSFDIIVKRELKSSNTSCFFLIVKGNICFISQEITFCKICNKNWWFSVKFLWVYEDFKFNSAALYYSFGCFVCYHSLPDDVFVLVQQEFWGLPGAGRTETSIKDDITSQHSIFMLFVGILTEPV